MASNPKISSERSDKVSDPYRDRMGEKEPLRPKKKCSYKLKK